MCVIKQTTHLLWTCRCNLSVRQSALLLTVFTHLGYRPRLIIPVSALIKPMFIVQAGSRSLTLKTKNPRSFDPRVPFGVLLAYATVLRDPWQISGVRSLLDSNQEVGIKPACLANLSIQ